MSQISQIKKIYHAAIYVRLSKEDGAVASHEKTESNSIANQREYLTRYARDHGYTNLKILVDDGYTGTNFAEVR